MAQYKRYFGIVSLAISYPNIEDVNLGLKTGIISNEECTLILGVSPCTVCH
jgi:hypothetical protein